MTEADEYDIIAERDRESIGYHHRVPFHEWHGFVRHFFADDHNLPTLTIDGVGTYHLDDNDQWQLDTTQVA